MTAGFAIMNRCYPFSIQDFSIFHRGINDPMIATFHAIFYRAFDIGKSIVKNGTTIISFGGSDTSKSILARSKRFEEMFHQTYMIAFCQNV